jgi:hypothetical protein
MASTIKSTEETPVLRSRRLSIWTLLGLAILTLPVSAADCPPLDPATPRTLILALDGVPYRAVRAAREMGAFEGWAETRPMVSTFPSMTNVGFTALLAPFGARPIPGYELRRYDQDQNRVLGGGVFDTKFNWREQFDLQLKGIWTKAGLYMTPGQTVRKELKKVQQFALEYPDEIMLALVSATDTVTHFQGDAAIVRALLEVSESIAELRRLHLDLYGRELQLVMFSDHGNAEKKVQRAGELEKTLRQAGLQPSKQLGAPDQVVTVTYGLVGYGVVYTDPSNVEKAARALVGDQSVALAAWRVGASELRVISKTGEASIRWRDLPSRRELAYTPVHGDPLSMLEARAQMFDAGVMDEQGFASRDDWFEWSAFAQYPDGVARLVDSLDGAWVSNSASVIFSLEPGYGWGVKAALVGAWLRAGPLEATHGSLDRESSWGFFMTSDPEIETPPAVRADRALVPWAKASECSSISWIHVGHGHEDGLHSPSLSGP